MTNTWRAPRLGVCGEIAGSLASGNRSVTIFEFRARRVCSRRSFPPRRVRRRARVDNDARGEALARVVSRAERRSSSRRAPSGVPFSTSASETVGVKLCLDRARLPALARAHTATTSTRRGRSPRTPRPRERISSVSPISPTRPVLPELRRTVSRPSEEERHRATSPRTPRSRSPPPLRGHSFGSCSHSFSCVTRVSAAAIPRTKTASSRARSREGPSVEDDDATEDDAIAPTPRGVARKPPPTTTPPRMTTTTTTTSTTSSTRSSRAADDNHARDPTTTSVVTVAFHPRLVPPSPRCRDASRLSPPPPPPTRWAVETRRRIPARYAARTSRGDKPCARYPANTRSTTSARGSGSRFAGVVRRVERWCKAPSRTGRGSPPSQENERVGRGRTTRR